MELCKHCGSEDVVRNQVIDIAVSKTREKAVFVRMAQRLERGG